MRQREDAGRSQPWGDLQPPAGGSGLLWEKPSLESFVVRPQHRAELPSGYPPRGGALSVGPAYRGLPGGAPGNPQLGREGGGGGEGEPVPQTLGFSSHSTPIVLGSGKCLPGGTDMAV